jgi:hypothetical protein
MNWQRKIFAALIISQVVFTFSALAQDGRTNSRAAGDKRKTSINFEDELVEGEVKKPELLYLLQKKQFNFKRLIKLRENFLPEMNRTAEEIGTSRGQN